MTASSTQNPPPQGTAVYVHWPFCKKKCPYCDFNSHVRDTVDHSAWRTALLQELRYWQDRAPNHRIASIFFGGGTPSLMEPATVSAIIDEVQKRWPVDTNIEITLEANPTSVEAAKFQALRAAGVNRVSLGVQSLRAESLAFLGREHSAEEALRAIDLSQKIFPRSSFDLIYALPGQTLESWEHELRDALRYAQNHLSLYQLTIEENTAFHHAYHVAKNFVMPEDNHAADLYALTQQLMDAAGLPAYEISNHAAPGEASRHNLAYWRSHSYVGIGPGAHGRVDMADGTRHATRNRKSPERWLQAGPGPEEEFTLTTQERAEEKILMGLRLDEGIDLSTLRTDEAAYLSSLWDDHRIDRLISQKMLHPDPQHLRTTPQGRPLLNYITQQLLV